MVIPENEDRVGAGAKPTVLRVVNAFDAWVIAGPGNLGAGLIRAAGMFVRRLQSGFVQSYLITIVAGLAAILGYLIFATHRAVR